jgi:hypothetical protein
MLPVGRIQLRWRRMWIGDGTLLTILYPAVGPQRICHYPLVIYSTLIKGECYGRCAQDYRYPDIKPFINVVFRDCPTG